MMQTLAVLSLAARAERVADAAITAALNLLFRTKKGLTPHRIRVTTRKGIMALTGSTDTLLARQRAEQLALAVRGGRGVINELTVRAADVSDPELTQAVAAALAANPVTGKYKVRGATAGGVVTLTGSLQSWAEKQLVLRVLQSVRGVRKFVAGQLIIRGGALRNSDKEITSQIRELLDWDIRLNGTLVQVRTTSGLVHLTGAVGTAAEKTRLVAIAYQAGAGRVEASNLQVADWALDPALRPDRVCYRPDDDLARAVRDSFRYNPRVLLSKLRVRVRDGVTLLSGTVSSLRAWKRAEQGARNVVGVRDVHNLLTVVPARFSRDGHLRQTIMVVLAQDPTTGGFDFNVNVHRGRVYLSGYVSTLREQQRAGEVVAGVAGVVSVDNQVEVSDRTGSASRGGAISGSAPTGENLDQMLAARIRMRFFWSANLQDQDVEVRVEDGRATLTGTVTNWLDREEAGLDAFEAGACDVCNCLAVHIDLDRLPAA